VLFITLLIPKGKGEEAVEYLKKLKAPKDITIHNVYFTFGRYDGIIIYEAPSTKAAMDFAMKVGFKTHYTMETLTAVEAKELPS